ncbi:hypothetical protein ElyMa_005812800 [Elysia marginata]|uniref:DUF7043 domain-containing protein n=1 Tax=Elysia marginata TaxID=1093978 RepID=A0AAV4FXC9_9GAST|nr:hypothetical protein ElyMa_005812800 [Elysia marginata]
MAHRILFVTVSILLSVVTMETDAECRFPDFLVKLDPWVGDYKRGNQFLVAYIKETYMDIKEPRDSGQSGKYKRNCVRQVTDTKYIVKHVEPDQSPLYACMEFFQRADNIVQLKVRLFV